MVGVGRLAQYLNALYEGGKVVVDAGTGAGDSRDTHLGVWPV